MVFMADYCISSESVLYLEIRSNVSMGVGKLSSLQFLLMALTILEATLSGGSRSSSKGNLPNKTIHYYCKLQDLELSFHIFDIMVKNILGYYKLCGFPMFTFQNQTCQHLSKQVYLTTFTNKISIYKQNLPSQNEC